MGIMEDFMDVKSYVSPTIDITAVIGRYIDKALAPWRTGGATAYMSDSMETRNPKFTIVVNLLPYYPFTYEIDRFKIDKYGEEVAYEIAREAYKFFLNRPTLPIDDHIILGED